MTDVELARSEIQRIEIRRGTAIDHEKAKLRTTLKAIRSLSESSIQRWQEIITLAEKVEAAKKSTADIMGGDDTLAEQDV